MRFLKLLFILFLLLSQVEAKEKSIDVASKISEKEKKPLLILFVDATSKNAISTLQFQNNQQFVFAEVNVSLLTNEEKKGLSDKYHLQDLPRLVLLDEKGQELSRYSVYGETPANIKLELLKTIETNQTLSHAMQNLEDICAFPLQLEELYNEALELKRSHDADKILQAGMTHEILFFLIEKYRLLTEKGDNEGRKGIREKIQAKDPNNEKKAFYSLALIDFQHLVAQKSEMAIQPLEDYVALFGEKDQENRWRLEMMIAQYYLNSDDWKTSLEHAEVAFQKAPLDMKKEIARCCDYIKGQLSDSIR